MPVAEASGTGGEGRTADVKRLRLGPVTLLRSSFPDVRSGGAQAPARRVAAEEDADRETYRVVLLLPGSRPLARGTEPAGACAPGELYLVDGPAPFDSGVRGVDAYEAEIRGAGAYGPEAYEPGVSALRAAFPPPSLRERRVEAVCLDFPASMLPWSRDRLRGVRGRRLPGGKGAGGMLADFLLSLDRRAPELGALEAPRAGTAAVDLVAAWLAQELDAPAAVPHEARIGALMSGIRGFIQRNLHDPRLSPAVVAAAHHLSLSYLHRVFGRQSGGETVAAWIRSQRLERARQDLEDPALRTTPVHAVAARWGMPRASDFSRSFRAAYGVSPNEHRMRAMRGAGGGTGAPARVAARRAV